MNRTTKYIAPNLYLDKSTAIVLTVIEPSILGYYVGIDEPSDNSTFVHIDPTKVDKEVLQTMLNSSVCISQVEEEDGTLLVEIKNHIDDLNSKFVEGKYSEMYSRDVALYRLPFHTRNVVLKSQPYREYLEYKYDTKIGDAELDSIPNLHDECFRYNSSTVNTAA